MTLLQSVKIHHTYDSKFVSGLSGKVIQSTSNPSKCHMWTFLSF